MQRLTSLVLGVPVRGAERFATVSLARVGDAQVREEWERRKSLLEKNLGGE